jgi:hypothetical protein
MMSASVFLLLNLALAFYNVGTIWAHEIDIFRTWKLIGRAQFHQVQMSHFRKIPYWIFAPVGLALLGNVALLWYHPDNSPRWCVWAALALQLLSILLTAAFWVQWQGRLARDERGPESPYLEKILRTHWLRTALINGYALVFLFWTVKVLG